MAYRTIGNTLVEWDDDEPLIFTLRGEVGPADNRVLQEVPIDFKSLRNFYTEDFLLNLKNYLIERCNRLLLTTLLKEAENLKRLFTLVIELELFESKVEVIDETFLLCLSAAKEDLRNYNLRYLKIAFKSNPYSPLFARGLNPDDFPEDKLIKGHYGSQIDRILAKVLSRASVARILDVCDTAYAQGSIDIGHYAYVNLAFAVFVRPESYRQIRVGDFSFDAKSKQYFIEIVTAKSGEHVPAKVRYGLNEPLGVLLTKQRQYVIATYGHLISKEDIEKLALFPARQLRKNGLWRHPYANQHFGMYQSSISFSLGYGRAIEKRLRQNQLTLSSNALRHTVGTLLAQTGASAKTIQSVLKHATDMTCKAYVDIAFKGLMQELSEAMRPAFANHLPDILNFRSKGESIAPEKRICSEEWEAGRIEEIGECGKDIACENAPIVCYGCFRFLPCWDADHSINLKIIEREIDEMTKRGKPFQHMLDRAKTAKSNIIFIMNAADRYRDAILEGDQA